MLNRVKNYNKNETERLADNARNLEILIQKFIWRRKIFKKYGRYRYCNMSKEQKQKLISKNNIKKIIVKLIKVKRLDFTDLITYAKFLVIYW